MFYMPMHIICESLVRYEARRFVATHWDASQKTQVFRMPLKGDAYECLDQELASKRLPPILNWTLFVRHKGNIQAIHADASAMNGYDRGLSSINIPIFGTEGSIMEWFDESECTLKRIEERVTYRPDPLVYWGLEHPDREYTPIASVEIDRCYAVNVSVPHRVIASDSQDRAVLTVRLYGNPDILSREDLRHED